MGLFTIRIEEIAASLDFELGTARRLENEAPWRLPPCVDVGSGTRKKRVYLSSSFEAWLKEREVATPKPNFGMADQSVLPKPQAEIEKRGRGRPRKIVTAASMEAS